MQKYVLEEKEKDYLELTIRGEVFKLPLSLGIGEFLILQKAFNENDILALVDFFRRYIRSDVLDTLELQDFTQLLRVWKDAFDANAKASGSPSVGES